MPTSTDAITTVDITSNTITSNAITTDAVILAAGYSSRADGFKMEFQLNHKAVIQHVIEAFLPICANIFVVGGYQYEKLLPLLEPYGDKVKLVVNEKFDNGMFSSVQTGVKHVVSEQFFVTPGDYPLITTNICNSIILAKKEFVIPSFHMKGGHPILMNSSCIEELLRENVIGNLKSFLKKMPVTYINMSDDGIMYDLDTRQDYIKLQNIMTRKVNNSPESRVNMNNQNKNENICENNTLEDLGIINGKVYIDGEFSNVNIYIKGEKISCITSQKLQCKKEVDAGGCMVLPGLIDPHVHFHLGVGDCVSTDDFHTGSIKAALGGITTYIDFLDPVKKASQIEAEFEKRVKLAVTSVTDYAFHTTIANPVDSPIDIIHASKEVGIPSIKLFTTYSSSDRRTGDNYIYELLKCSKDEEIKVVVHAENDELVSGKKEVFVKDHEKSRPAISENIEVMKLAMMAKETGGNLYIVHVSAGSSVEQLVRNFENELNSHQITLESCPHYFIFDSSVYEQEDGYRYTMTPPLRPEMDRKLLNQYMNYISTIGTDHCPFDESYKKHIYTSDISMGIGGLQYSFLNMYSLFQDKIIDKFTKGPAKAYGLYPTKGTLVPGADADILIFDDKAQTTVKDAESVYSGKTLQGAIKEVYLRGQLLVSEGKVYDRVGKYIRR